MDYINLGKTGLKVPRICPRLHDLRHPRHGLYCSSLRLTVDGC